MSIVENVHHVQKCLLEAVRKRDLINLPCRLVAVSKTKPVTDVIQAYNAGVRHFGENYIQELFEKSNDAAITENCPEIKWHFIGHLQSNKSKLLTKVKNLYLMETVDSMKLCDKLNYLYSNQQEQSSDGKLKVLVQVNSSGEAQKHGIDQTELIPLVDYITKKCPNLDFKGLMTIGSYNHNYDLGENPDFEYLLSCRNRVLDHLGWRLDQMEVSMGMSNDYIHAISKGSTSVRVGSSIFGSRQYTVN